MRIWAGIVMFAASLATLPTSRAVAGDEKVAGGKIDALVRDLGSDSFATREQASRRLRELGIATREALERAAGAPDAEVRLRARSILAEVRALDFESRLAHFLADYDGSGKQSLPAWDQFSAQYGTSRLSRELFVEMHRSESELLEALARGARSATAALDRRTQEILDDQSESMMDLGTLASLLFVACADGVTVDERRCMRLYPYVVHSAAHRHMNSALWPAVLKKMVAQWLAQDSTPLVANQNLIFATQLEMKPEALAIARRVLAEESTPVNSRVVAIRVVGHFDGKAELPAVEKKLDDSAICMQIEQPEPAQTQVRDVALMVLLRVTGQRAEDYGCEPAAFAGDILVQTSEPIFSNDKARQTALQKWDQWRAEHPHAFD